MFKKGDRVICHNKVHSNPDDCGWRLGRIFIIGEIRGVSVNSRAVAFPVADDGIDSSYGVFLENLELHSRNPIEYNKICFKYDNKL